MVALLRREFVVDVPCEVAWRHLARVAHWPTWAGHIRRVDLEPAGELTPASRGTFRFRGGATSQFRMTAWEYPRRWAWVGPLLWLTIHYDHRFDPLDDGRTRLVWTLEGEGRGVGVAGRLFAALYGRMVDRAIPRLVAQMNAAGATPG